VVPVSDPLDDPINRKIWDMRIRARLPMAQVSEETGLSRSQVWRRLTTIVEAVPTLSPEEVTTYRRIEIANLEENEAVIQDALLACGQSDHLGISRLSNALLRVQKRRSSLLGLDAPKHVRVEGLVQDPVGVVLDRVRLGISAAEEHIVDAEIVEPDGLESEEATAESNRHETGTDGD